MVSLISDQFAECLMLHTISHLFTHNTYVQQLHSHNNFFTYYLHARIHQPPLARVSCKNFVRICHTTDLGADGVNNNTAK